jgi:uncharacterized protein (TIGR03435 family)
MVRARFWLAVAATAGLIGAQDARPQFEVASIKPNAGAGRGSKFGSRGPGTFYTENIPLRMMIAEAYGVKQFQITSGPAWISSDGYDITAKPGFSEGTGPVDQRLRTMLRLQRLLEERFRLKFHRETKEMPVYLLTVVNGGLKLAEADCVKFDIDHPPSRPADGAPRPRYCGNMRMGKNGPNMTVDGIGIEMSNLIFWLTDSMSRTVIDNTGYTGTFDAKVEYAPDLGHPPPGMGGGEVGSAGVLDNAGPSLFSALQEQLGLKLEASRGPVEILVIERVERPTAN